MSNKYMYEAEATLINDFMKDEKLSWKSFSRALAVSAIATGRNW